ncbi:hypothetical protein BH10BAC4_BH10BAC4_09380 [soil metagenome]
MEPKEDIDLNKYIAWIQEGKSFSAIREDLKSLGFPDDDIKRIINKVDDEIIALSINRNSDAQMKLLKLISKVAFALGACLVLTYFVIDSITAFSLGITCIASGVAIVLFQRKVKDGRAPGLDREKRKFNIKRE